MSEVPSLESADIKKNIKEITKEMVGEIFNFEKETVEWLNILTSYIKELLRCINTPDFDCIVAKVWNTISVFDSMEELVVETRSKLVDLESAIHSFLDEEKEKRDSSWRL